MFNKIRLEFKILFFLELLIAIILLMINFIYIFNYKMEIENHLRKEIELYMELIKTGKNVKIPNYLKIRKSVEFTKDYTLFFIKNDKYVFLRSSYIKEKVKNKIYLILYWDLIAIFLVAVFYYFLLYRFVMMEKSYSKNFEILLFVFSHKLKNFLSNLKVNLELLDNNDAEPVKRIVKYQELLSSDIDKINAFLQKISQENTKIVSIDICALINEILQELDLNFLEIKKKFNQFRIDTVKQDVYFAFYLILDNVKKYSKNWVYIRVGIINRLKYVIIKNDIKEDVESGLGVGLNVAEKLLEKYGFSLKYRAVNNQFIVGIRLSKRINLL